MATIQDRQFTRNYSGLRNQLAVAGVLAAVCLTGYELMRRTRRGRGLLLKKGGNGALGSVETWEFGYLYQGRCWAKNPSPALPTWPLAWVKQAIMFPEKKLPELIGIDATLYIRFLKGIRWFIALHTITTFPIIFSIHIIFSSPNISLSSMEKASISSVIQSTRGIRVLFVHVIVMYWITITWIMNLLWILRGLFRYRAESIQACATEQASMDPDHPGHEDRALRLRTVMVSNVPVHLRSESELKKYFEYYMARSLASPPGHGFLLKIMTFLFNRASRSSAVKRFRNAADTTMMDEFTSNHEKNNPPSAIVERVVIARKMTELASLLERREEILRNLEHEHIKLAQKALSDVRGKLDGTGSENKGLLSRISTRRRDEQVDETSAEDDSQWQLVVDALAPFISEFHVPSPKVMRRNASRFRHLTEAIKQPYLDPTPAPSPSPPRKYGTVWEALHSLPRSALDAYQPLIRLSRLFRGHAVPAIDYFNTKLGLLTAFINENRGRSLEAFTPSSTAFVTFEKIEDARRAAKYLQVHPRNPLACIVVPAPDAKDLDWARVMKSSFKVEFLKDWVVELSVWAFTCSWIIPISFLIGLVNISNLGVVVPGLESYFDKHAHDKEAISSLLPTILFSLLTILIPMLLLLIAKKAHTIVTYSKLHDTIMVRYWKFLVCNLLIFFCVGVSALESFLQSFKLSFDIIPVVASSFPTAGPFYVGDSSQLFFKPLFMAFWNWVYLPLILYPSTKASKTLRRRAAGTRPRTFNFYYWLPNHTLVTTIVVCFALLNPLVIPFALVYFCVESVIVKHQLIHVYAKQYENNGKLLLIRLVRYSIDGLVVAHVIFLAFLIVLKQTGEATAIGVLLGLTTIAKFFLTFLCRTKFSETDRAEDFIYSAPKQEVAISNFAGEPEPVLTNLDIERTGGSTFEAHSLGRMLPYGSAHFWTWKLPRGVPFHYASYPPHHRRHQRPDLKRGPIPFERNSESFVRLDSLESSKDNGKKANDTEKVDSAASTSLQQTADGGGPDPAGNQPSSVVTSHPMRSRWDDSPRLDLPYENPCYTAPIDNFLWLPRNPFGILDLDDSIDLHEALTSQLGAGQLGKWLDGSGERGFAELVETPGEMSSPENEPADPIATKGAPRSTLPFQLDRPLNGNETISMSSVLLSRADQDDDVASINPPHSFKLGPRRTSQASSRRPVSVHGRQGSIFAGMEPLHRPLTSTGSQFQRTPRLRTKNLSHDPADEPDIQVQGDLITAMESRFELPQADESRSRERLAAVPMRDAVIGEVIVEEQEEALERIRKEESEQKAKGRNKSSWWNAWLWYRSSGGDALDHATEGQS